VPPGGSLGEGHRRAVPVSQLPPNLPPCDHRERRFPKPWKESYYRRHYDSSARGYVCPVCGNVFCGTRGFDLLQADHITPWAKGGKTVWENMVLLCASCNNRKSDSSADQNGEVHDSEKPQQEDGHGR
jgi:5-methylcytosine-specific restriction endonuclease McrA